MEYGLIVVWEMLEHQAPYLEGREAELFSMLLRVRYSNQVNVIPLYLLCLIHLS